MCIFDNATCIQLISIPPWLSFHFTRSCSFVVCFSLFSSLAWTNIFVRILFWVSLLVSTFPLPWSETAGEAGRGGKRESGREQINCIILAYKLNPRHKCRSSCDAFRREGSRQRKWKTRDLRVRSAEMEVGRWSERGGKTSFGEGLAWVTIKRWWFCKKRREWWRARAQGGR